MKVAYFIGSLNRGGTEMLTLDICRRHAEAPYDMLLVYRNEGNMSDMYRETGVTMKRIKPKRFHFLRYLWQLRQFMKQEQVDVVHAQTLGNGVIAVFFLLFTRIKLVTTFHGFFYGIKSAIYATPLLSSLACKGSSNNNNSIAVLITSIPINIITAL